MGLDCALGDIVEVLVVEDVELVQAGVEEAIDGRENREEDCEDAEVADREAATAAAAGSLFA